MPREVRTDLILTSKTRGFGQSQQELGRVAREARKSIDEQVKGFQSSGKAYKGAEKEIKRLESVLQDLAVQQLAINREMEKVGDKGTKEYKALATELKSVNQEAQRVTATMTTLDRAFMRQRAARQGFVQGLMQGAAPGIAGFLQRGPGMRQQMMGQMIGGGVRRGVGGLAGGVRAAGTTLTGGMFAGAQGVAQGLGALPLVGGILGPAASRALAQAQQKMQAQQVQLQTMPYLGGMALQQRVGMAGAQARATITDVEIERQAERNRIHERLIPTPDHYQKARRMVERYKDAHAESKMERRPIGGGFLGAARDVERMRLRGEAAENLGGEAVINDMIESQAMELSGREAETRTRENLRRERSQRVSQARRRTRRQALGLGMGVQFGMDINAERQFRAQVMQAGGGFGGTAQERQMSRTAMAAQTAFGVGAGVSGAFLQAGRRGGLVGGEGRASEAFVSALGDALKMGLGTEETNEYLSQIASGITSWKTTGIPFNKQSMADIAGTLGGMGLGGVRGMAIAGGVSRAAEQLSRTGPQSVGQLMMLRTLGGMGPGQTGMEAMEDALIRLEKKQFEGDDFKRLIEGLLRAGGGGAEGRRVAYGVLQQAGIQVSREELKAIDEGADPETLKKIREERERGARLAKKTADTPEALARAAMEAVPNALKEQAKLTNRQIANGKNLVDSMAKLEAVAQSMTEMMTTLLAPIFEKLGIAAEDLTGNIKIAQTKAKNWVETLPETGSN